MRFTVHVKKEAKRFVCIDGTESSTLEMEMEKPKLNIIVPLHHIHSEMYPTKCP